MTTLTNAGLKGYNTLHFEWFLVDWCNFKCSYCNAADRMSEKYSKQTSPSKYKLVLERLRRLDMDFEIDIFGGEPTLHPEFLSILEQLSSMPNCKLIEIKTNLSKSLTFFQEVVKFDKVRLAASFHAEYYDLVFLTKCVALKDSNFYCHINLSDKPNDWPMMLRTIDNFDRHSVKYDLNVLLSTPDYTVNYSDEFYNLFEKHLAKQSDKSLYRLGFDNGTEEWMPVFLIHKNKLGNFNGFNCQALLYEITAEGDFINSCTRQPLPLFIKEEDVMKNSVCPKTVCHADMMLNFYKERNV